MTTSDEQPPSRRGPDVVDRYERAARSLLGLTEAACESRADFAGKAEAALRAGLAFLAANPGLASLLTVEPYATGEGELPMIHQRWLERFGALLGDAALHEPDAFAHPDFVDPTIVAGVCGQIAGRVVAAQAEQLELLLPDLLEFTLIFYLDPLEVRRIARATRSSRP
ncbi:MAG TPA: hypothetical protein VHU86_00230 [Solirubrobacterales bacterium]|jgi:hypothetical protein|nr:hypothetical protein [Solirubrobacterales bacterium]